MRGLRPGGEGQHFPGAGPEVRSRNRAGFRDRRERACEENRQRCSYRTAPATRPRWATSSRTSKNIMGRVPVVGICLGHQILAQALGGRTYKLKFGHHGANHPVQDLSTKKVDITSQNHSFAVDPESLPAGVAVTHSVSQRPDLRGFKIGIPQGVQRAVPPRGLPRPARRGRAVRCVFQFLRGGVKEWRVMVFVAGQPRGGVVPRISGC